MVPSLICCLNSADIWVKNWKVIATYFHNNLSITVIPPRKQFWFQVSSFFFSKFMNTSGNNHMKLFPSLFIAEWLTWIWSVVLNYVCLILKFYYIFPYFLNKYIICLYSFTLISTATNTHTHTHIKALLWFERLIVCFLKKETKIEK